MINRVGTTISLEAWDNKYKPNQDWNHAWGAAPANIIPRCLMGVKPLEPGWRKLRIRPQPGSLSSASLDIPTVRGDVHVDFRNEPRRFVLRAYPNNLFYCGRLQSPMPALSAKNVLYVEKTTPPSIFVLPPRLRTFHSAS